MTIATASLPPRYFEDVYGANDDPWGFETSPYERAKYAATLAALPRPRYRRAFEIGCSIGVLSERLARRCDDLLAVDVVPSVLARARARCREFPQARFAEMSVPVEFPEETFDLILVSEVGYYWGREDFTRAREQIVRALEPDGHLLLVHWTPAVHDYPLSGDEVHDRFLAEAGPHGRLRHLTGGREETYRLDLLERRGQRSGAGQRPKVCIGGGSSPEDGKSRSELADRRSDIDQRRRLPIRSEQPLPLR